MVESPVERDVLTPFCPAYTRAIEILGRRWTGAIVRSMLAGATRFGDIRKAVPSLSDRLLSERLRELEREGVVERRVTPSTPVRIEYMLTDKGRGLASVVRAVAEWAETWSSEEPVTREPEQPPSASVTDAGGLPSRASGQVQPEGKQAE